MRLGCLLHRSESQMSEKGKLVVISGPSGSGKSTIVAQAMKRTGAEFSVSVTTRKPRPGEVAGQHYRFVSGEEFEIMRRSGELLEWAEVFGQLYGTPTKAVAEAIEDGQSVLLDIDVQGGMQVYGKMPSATFVLIVPPDGEELTRRLRGRGTEGQAELAERLAKAQAEVAVARDSGIYGYEVVNDDLERAVNQVVDIINGC